MVFAPFRIQLAGCWKQSNLHVSLLSSEPDSAFARKIIRRSLNRFTFSCLHFNTEEHDGNGTCSHFFWISSPRQRAQLLTHCFLASAILWFQQRQQLSFLVYQFIVWTFTVVVSHYFLGSPRYGDIDVPIHRWLSQKPFQSHQSHICSRPPGVFLVTGDCPLYCISSLNSYFSMIFIFCF